jgi:hypothetical protein
MKEITLKEFLEKNRACEEYFDFAKDLTLEEFLNTCERGDWILWLFAKTNPNSLRELTLAKGHCANTVRELMEDERSTKAVDVAIAFGEGKATIEELDAASNDAWAAFVAASISSNFKAAFVAFCAAYVVASAADVAATVADAFDDDAFDGALAALDNALAVNPALIVKDDLVAKGSWASRVKNQKQTADICRKYLPIQIWDQNLI